MSLTKCRICHIDIPTSELKIHKQSETHKIKVDLIDVLEQIRINIYEGYYSDNGIKYMLEILNSDKLSEYFN